MLDRPFAPRREPAGPRVVTHAPPVEQAWVLPAEPVTGTTTITATGHRATLSLCRCGLPVGGEGYDASVDPEPPDVAAVTVLGQVPCAVRWDRGVDGLWHAARSRYQSADPPRPWRDLGVCAEHRRHRLVPLGT